MMNYLNNLISKLEGWQKKAFIIIAVITATQFLTPYGIETYNFFVNSYKVQRDYKGISERIDNLEEYTEHLNGIIDGIGDTRYHRGVRYLLTKGSIRRPLDYDSLTYEIKLRWDISHCDWYYEHTDTDGLVKWFGAKYNSQKDIFDYIDHDGEHHIITPIKDSVIY